MKKKIGWDEFPQSKIFNLQSKIENSPSFPALTTEIIRHVLAEYVESGESKALKLFKTLTKEG